MKKNATNLTEFKALIKRYETITLDEIEELDCDREELTGFGTHRTCTLCQAVPYIKKDLFWDGPNCRRCVYPGDRGCLRHETYDAIETAEGPEELLAAYRARARYMRSLIKEKK